MAMSESMKDPAPAAPKGDAEHRAPRGGSGEMFDGIAHRYDLLNRLMSFGIDSGWRKKTVRALELERPTDTPGREKQVLDLATGTADLALAVAQTHDNVAVVGVDPSSGMLDIGREKITARGLDARVRLEVGDAQALSFADDTFDGICMAFGIRNVPDRALALREMARTVRPGGRVAILELSEPRSGIIAPLARFHIRTLVPRLGALISGASEYRYLQESIAAFPSPEDFATMMGDAGMDIVSVTPLTFGVCQLYVGTPTRETP